MAPPPQATSSRQSPPHASTTPSPTDNNDNPPSSSRLSKDSEGYPSWLPKRPPPPAPASTFQSSMMGGLHDTTPSPVEPAPFVGGRKPTPRSVRIVSLQDSFVGAVEKETRFNREPTDQTRVGVHVPPKVWTRASGAPPTAFNASEHDEFLPLPQPRFNAKNLHLRLLMNPSRWMKLYFYFWPLIVFYHIPLQTFFDFNAVFILLQVAKFPNPQSSGKNWALGAAAYIACWLVWIFVVCIMYELIYSFARRWRLRRPLMLPIYLSGPAFNLAALTSYTNFSFLQHIRFSAFFPEPASDLPPQSPSDPDYDFDELLEDSGSSWKSGIAETCYFYSQNLPTVALLLPRAGLCLALLFAFSDVPLSLGFTSSPSRRDETYFREDGTLSDYARGVLIANAAWTAWRALVLLFSWFGLWILSNQRLGGLCGPRHTWEETDQEKTRSIYSEAASEYGAYRGSFYHSGAGADGALDYAGDELAWEWREATRMRVQDAFEFCLTSRKRSSGGGAGLRWSSSSGTGGAPAAQGYYGFRNRRYANRHRRRRSAKGKEPSTEKAGLGDGDVGTDQPFEGIERVLAAVGFPSAQSPARRGILTKDLFAEPEMEERPSIEPLRFEQHQPVPSTSMYTGLEAPKMAKRNSKDKIPGSSTAAGAPLMNLPYPFSRPGAGQVSSKDLVPFPAGAPGLKTGSKRSKGSGSSSGKSGKSKSSKSKTTSSGSKSGSGSTEDDDEEEEEEEEDDDDDEEEEDDEFDSEEPSSGRASGSMSSLGQPINSPSRYPFGNRRPVGAGHGRSMSGVSSGMSSGAGVSGGSHAHSHSMSSSHGTRSGGAMSVLSQSTGNMESTDSEFGVEGRGRASLSHGSSTLGAIPMPPRHPHPHGHGRGRNATTPVSPAAPAVVGTHMLHTAPVTFPTVHQARRRADSGRGIVVDPSVLYGEGFGSDVEGRHEVQDIDLDQDDDDEEEEEEEEGEAGDHVGLLGLPISPRNSLLGSRVSLANSLSSGAAEARSRTHSSVSTHSSRSRNSSTRARSRTRTHSSHGPSVRERASSLGTSMRSLMRTSAASLTQLDLVMRGATGPAAGLGVGSRPRSRVNSSMARLEEDVVLSTSGTEMTERLRDASGGSSGSGSGNHNGDVVMNSIPGRFRREVEGEAEGYSSGGTHSRSGSESVSAENYTFGRPVLFMRPAQEQPHQERVDEEEEIVLVERSNNSTGRNSPNTSAPVPIVMATREPGSEPQSVTDSFYSQQPSVRTVNPVVLDERTPEHSPERQGIAIPWRQRGLLALPARRRGELAEQDSATTSSGSPPDISTAAGSFVTAAATMEGNTTTTGSISQRSIASSWDGTAAAGRGRLSGGMVERPGEDMGAGGDGWRVV
ncbi:hypothetical protein B0H34DRAFT_109453 [Crassisporium funariophilum]|nr:hypothetical protein B0H34DRAFT_109453 [Crassisporium funariophilum]